MIAFQLKDYLELRPEDNRLFTDTVRRAIQIVTANYPRPASLPSLPEAAVNESDSHGTRNRSTSVEPSYISNWTVDSTRLRRDIRAFLATSSPYVESVTSGSAEPDSSRRQSTTSATTAEEAIYRDPIGPEPEPEPDMSGQPPPGPITDAQLQRMLDAAADKAVQAYIQRNPPQPGPPGPPGPQGQQGIDGASGSGGSGPHWRPEELGFFDPQLPASYGVGPMVRDGKDLYYRNVHLFCERVLDLATTKGQELVRANLNTCLRGSALTWYTAALSRLERTGLRNLELEEGWIKELTNRFKPNHATAINSVIAERYTIADVRSGRDPSEYVQQIVSNAKDANFHDTQQQLTWAWRNLDPGLKRDIPMPAADTSVNDFLVAVELKKEVWQEFYGLRGGGRDDRNERRPARQISKPTSNSRQGGNRDGYSPPESSSYYRSGRAYNDQKYQSRGFNQRSGDTKGQPRAASAPPTQQQLPAPRQPLRITGGNASDSKNQNQTRPRGGKSAERSGKGFKRRAYVVDESDEENDPEPEPAEEDFLAGYSNDDGQAYYSEDLVYYDPDHPDDTDQEPAISHFTVSVTAICRRCKKSFASNNKLHRHIREAGCLSVDARLEKPSASIISDMGKPSAASYIRKSSAVPAYAVTASSVNATKASSEPAADPDAIPIVTSDVDASKDIGTGCGYRGWNYAKVEVALSADAKPESACMDTGSGVTLADRQFFHRQNPNVPIRTMATPLTVRGISSDQHQTADYAIVPMYFLGQKDGKTVKGMIRREVHLIDNLKANMLIGNDVTGPEKWNMDYIQNQAVIGSCGVTIPLDIRRRSVTGQPVHKPVHIKKSVVVPPQAEMTIPIHHLAGSLPNDRDYLFEPDESDLTLYAHLMDASTEAILVRNDGKQAVKIPRNFRLGHLTEIDYPNAFFASEGAEDLAMKAPRSTHKTSWFKKVIATFATALAATTAVAPASPASSATAVSPVLTSALAVPYAGPLPPETSSMEKPSAPIVTIPPPASSGKSFPAASSSTPSPAAVPVTSPADLVLPNGVTIYPSAGAEAFSSLVAEFPALWRDSGFADLPKEDWMRIPLKSDWEDKIPGKAKVYPLGAKDRALVDQTFDELHDLGRLSWTNESTPFSYPVFCIWKDVNGERKGRVVVDIRGLNSITQPDVYPLPLQMEIISAVRDCPYITVVDASAFFYQWRVHPDDRHKLTVVSHRGQESFNVAVMGYKNSPAYVQRQIDRLLRAYRKFARAYVDDIVIFSRTLEEHLSHLRQVFGKLVDVNVSIKPTKAFIGYPSVQLLGQKVDSFGLSTSEEKLRAIAKLQFPRTLRQLETYLGLTGWMREYVPFYAGVSKPLQKRKTALLKPAPKEGSARKAFASRTRIEDRTPKEVASYKVLQSLLSAPTYLTHHDPRRQTFVDLDASKEFGIGAVVYHVKEGCCQPGEYPPRSAIQPIMFLSRLLNSAETRYWPTEMEVAGIVWVLRKIRHLIESAALPTVIYTDHGAALGIAKQTTLTSSSTDKLNLRLVRASDYIQRFDLDIRHKPGRTHIVPDALSRLASLNTSESSTEGELDALFTLTGADTSHPEIDVLFTCSLVEMDAAFRQKILNGYKAEAGWKRILDVLGTEDGAHLPFSKGEHGLIFRLDGATGDHAFVPRRLCVPDAVVKDVLETVHGGSSGHPGYAKCYERVSSAWYIRGLARQLRQYLKHCPECQLHRTRRHPPYGSLQPILSPAIPFHTLTIDFILALPVSRVGQFNAAMPVTCKFTKRVTIVLGKDTWSAAEWGEAFLDQLDIGDWGIPKIIISDRDRKFMSGFWRAVFTRLGVRLLYSTAYHPQTDGQSERTNQEIEIALRFHISTLDNPADWPVVIPRIQRGINNSPAAATGKTPNEASYGFTLTQPTDLLQSSAEPLPQIVRMEAADEIAFVQIRSKIYKNQKHQPANLAVGDWAQIRLHKGYNIPSTAVLGSKLSQQYTAPFRVIEKIGRLAYRLDIPREWTIHPVFSIAQLEPCPNPAEDPFRRARPTNPDPVYVEGDTELVKSFELERIINKRMTARRGIEYLVRWKGYGPEHDAWRNIPELGHAKDLIQQYEDSIRHMADLPGRHRLPKPARGKLVAGALPASQRKSSAVALPASRRKSAATVLPAPQRKSAAAALPAPRRKTAAALPAPPAKPAVTSEQASLEKPSGSLPLVVVPRTTSPAKPPPPSSSPPPALTPSSGALVLRRSSRLTKD